jgi:hypothetical protein
MEAIMAQPHLILYIDGNFGGLHTHVFQDTPDFTKLALGGVDSGIGGDWNDKVSSFVIVSGRWQFFKDVNFKPAPLPFPFGLGPGIYPSVEAVGIDNDSLSSVKVVAETPF